MAMFGKKQKEKEKKDKSKTAKPDFKVVLWEDVGYSVREIKTFNASRFVDEDKTPFIYNEDLNFMELYPQDMKDNIFFKESEIDKKLTDTTKKLKAIKEKKIEDYKEDEPNTEDLKFEIRKLQAKKRSFKFSLSGSYVSFDSEGQVTFNFLRKGNSFFPFKWDTDTSTIHTASEPVVKKAGILLRNKREKYSMNNLVSTATIIVLVIGVLLTLANIGGGIYMWKKYDSSNIGELERKSLETQNICSGALVHNVEVLNKMLDKTEEYIKQEPQTEITGIIPE